ncbi:MAG: imidazole glycerol phosphate synthase subunit HisF [Candidatus Spechtbacteria bacterium RIFCSPHIGHO2_02_FULL_43_15b]|uniref:imidazole glycerol-phosphate synthase n=1 Tax=Candidatus Spechtbacteria bacterium RIFCSPHIGHO2_01_FULL_43_30 TaxID=1802158 RepID=A0A1G2H4S5_9BACT|nr:MAG: imidazole glycerol phosphate synthase subunit HisF [Candidatus Spechtbacteria bacterium RIFCSPHIGHO2_01_FULL_43_30]OGZ59035.1 MAG: imidazole glycerol phosphate synthase subunit HisF [Candidatus Spechtbacteria bacterium RIFCSPHIGHO2_02_FULL_43_15b]
MLKTRVIPCLTIKDLRLVKSVNFSEHRNIGSYISAVRVFNSRDVDEMIFLDLDARKDGIKKWLLEEISKECFMPLTLGGGVKSLDDINLLLRIGADKVSINTSAIETPDIISEGAKKFGSQCVVSSIDARLIGGKYKVFSAGGKSETSWSAVDWAKEVEQRGAGEIFLTSIDKEGLMEGYDLELVKSVSDAVNIPVIACGGAGKLDDFILAIKIGRASAVAAASIFQYTQMTPRNIKEYLVENGIEARL